MVDQRVDIDACRGRVLDHGAHVVEWAPSGHAPVLWCSAHAVFADGVAVRGGVPICFPWFGPGRSGKLTPAHGFARISQWRLVGITEEPATTTVVHELDEALASIPEFPHTYRAIASVRFGEVLQMSLMVENTGAESFSFEAALHTYLGVGDSTSIAVEGLEGDAYLDQVTGRTAVQDGPVRIDGEVDRVYSSTATVRVVDPSLGRVLEVSKSGSESTVVWNPWVEKAARLADFGDDEWRTMVCVETANIGPHAVSLAPGESHGMSVQIDVAELPG